MNGLPECSRCCRPIYICGFSVHYYCTLTLVMKVFLTNVKVTTCTTLKRISRTGSVPHGDWERGILIDRAIRRQYAQQHIMHNTRNLSYAIKRLCVSVDITSNCSEVNQRYSTTGAFSVNASLTWPAGTSSIDVFTRRNSFEGFIYTCVHYRPLWSIIGIGHASEFYSRLILWQNNFVPGTSQCYLGTKPHHICFK